MDARELLKELMRRSGDNPNSLAAKLHQKTKQPQIYKFLEGIAKEPRRATLQPIADHYRIDIEAFYSPTRAEQVLATDIPTSSTVIGYSAVPSTAAAQTQITLGQALEFLAGYLETLAISDRKRAVRSISDLAEEPEAHAKITACIEAMASTAFHQRSQKNRVVMANKIYHLPERRTIPHSSEIGYRSKIGRVIPFSKSVSMLYR